MLRRKSEAARLPDHGFAWPKICSALCTGSAPPQSNARAYNAGASIIIATHSPEKLLEKATSLIVKNAEDKFEQIDPKQARFTRSVIVRLKDGTMHHVALHELKDFLVEHDAQLLDIISERTVAIG